MSGSAPSDGYRLDVQRIRQQSRILQLLDAAEQAGIAPLASNRLHAFAYLADVLSPVWDLSPFNGKIYKYEGGPHYPDLQLELDHLVAIGLVQISNLKFVDRGESGARIDGLYALNFASPQLLPLLEALGAVDPTKAIDRSDAEIHSFLVELANALATLPDDEIDVAAGVDATYSPTKHQYNIIDFEEWDANASWRAAERFRAFLPNDASLSAGEKLYLYATYLGRLIHAA